MIQFKIMFDRIKNYTGMIQFIMVGYLFIVNTGFNLMATLILIGASSMVLAVIDYKYILPREYDRLASRNPALVRIEASLKRLEAKK